MFSAVYKKRDTWITEKANLVQTIPYVTPNGMSSKDAIKSKKTCEQQQQSLSQTKKLYFLYIFHSNVPYPEK